MPGLYGFSGNSNVSVNVGNTIGLYQQNTGNVYVVNNAITLLNTLSQAGNVNFALTDGNSKVLAYTANIGTPAGTYGNIDYYPVLSVTSDGRVTAIDTVSVSAATGGYGNANVAAFLPGYTGSLSNSSSIISLVANAAAQAASIDNLNSEFTSLNSTVIAQGAQIALKANIAGQVFTGNVQAPYFIGDGSQLTNLPVGSIYSNTNVAAYLTTASIDTTGNIAAANLTTAGNLTASYVKGDGSQLTNLPVQPGTYSNTNVTALLSSNTVSTITTTGNITTVASVNTNQLHTTDGIYSQGNITAPYFVGDGSSLTNIVTKLIAGANIAISPAGGQGQVTISTIGGTAGNTSTGYYGSFYDTSTQYANVATTAYVVNVATTIGNNGVTLTNGNAVTIAYAGVYNYQFSAQLRNTGVGGAVHSANIWLRQNGVDVSNTVRQVQVPAKSASVNGAIFAGWNYVLPVNAGDTLQLVWQQDSGDSSLTLTAQTAGTSPTRPEEPSVIVSVTQVTTVQNVYGNSNVATFLSSGFGSNTISTTGNITAGNLIATSYVQGDGSKLTNLPVQAGTYSNANVSAYLPAYNGSIGSTASVMNNINMGGTLTVAPNIVIGTTPSTTITNGSYSTNGGSAGTFVTLTASTGNVFAGSTTGNTAIQDGAVTTSGRVTAGNVTSTNGYFWANGTAYSTAGAATAFNGNLTGNALTDSTNLRVLVNASPYSAPNTSTGLTSNYVNTVPVYTSGVLQSPTLNTTVGAAVSSNVAYQSGYQGTTNKTYTNFVSYAQVWPTTANTMLNQDRVRATATQLDVLLNGKTWGTMSSASQGAIVLNSQGGQTTVYGPGQAASIVGASGTVNIIPSAGSANVQYATGQYAAVQQTSGASGATASNIAYARLFAGAVSGQTGNITVQNAVGLHTFSGWVSSNVSLVTNAYAVLNEDSRSIIQTNGNLTVTGTLATTGNTRVTGYWNPSKRYANPSSGNVAVSGANMQAFQQIALAGSAGITASSNGFDTVYDFKIEQDGTGGRALTWYDASGSSNTQVYGFLNPIPNSATITRAIMSDTGLWTVNYANPTAPANTAATWRSYPGVVGAIVAISDAGGKLAYWDTTNSRWSYIFDNSAV